MSLREGGPVGQVTGLIIDPNKLKIIAFRLGGGLIARGEPNILDARSVREYSLLGMVIDDMEDLVGSEDVVRIHEVLEMNFSLPGMRVETKKGAKVGRIENFTVDTDSFVVTQLSVVRPALKRIMEPRLLISRKEIVEVTDRKVIIKNDKQTLHKELEQEEFRPSYVNPFRNSESGFAPADMGTPDDKDKR